MEMRKRLTHCVLSMAVLAIVAGLAAFAAPRKAHSVALGAAHKVPYSKAGDPAGAATGEDSLKIRALLVDGALKEWVTGDAHDVTDRSFVVRRAVRLNDAFPSPPQAIPKSGQAPQPASAQPAKPASSQSQWVWQRGPWLLVDRVTGKATPLKLPDFDPAVSQASWFRDYAAYCGVTASGKSLYAVVAQIAARKPVLAKKLASIEREADTPAPLCSTPEWQREPLRVTFHPAGKDEASFNIIPGSAVLVEDSADDAETKSKPD